jgi:hypothetical protein
MPYESSLPLVFACIVLAAISIFAWLTTTARPWLIIALVSATAGIAAIVADRLVETDREQLQGLFPCLAAAAERQDIDTILASLDPELSPTAGRRGEGAQAGETDGGRDHEARRDSRSASRDSGVARPRLRKRQRRGGRLGRCSWA